jgi:hypothetical protein
MVGFAGEVLRQETDPPRESVLRRQTATTRGASAGSGHSYRLDPAILPVCHAAPAVGSTGEAAFILDRERAVVRRGKRSDSPVMATVPVASYAGVAVRMKAIGNAGAIRVFVEVLHADPSLTLQLAVADSPEAVAADWQAWGRALDLPLLIVGQDGTVSQPLKEMGGLVVTPPKQRRHHSFFADRRPRFLTRRKTGRDGENEQIAGREIIARD